MTKPYTVRAGETLSMIARRHDVTWQALYHSPDNAAFRAKRPNPDRIFPGDVLHVPGVSAGWATPVQYTPPVAPAKANIRVVAARIRAELAGNDDADMEFLARLFDDDRIDDGPTDAVAPRLQNILAASSNGANNGVTHFGGIYAGCHDRGFRAAFKDPWPPSDNQVGHFTTGVDMGYRPHQAFALVPDRAKKLVLQLSAPIPKDEYVCLRLIVGHEQVSDEAAVLNAERAFIAPREEHVVAFYKATRLVDATPLQNLQATRAALAGIPIGDGVGNSMEDLHLSLYGYRFGQMIREGALTGRRAAARWLRINLGGILDEPPPPPGAGAA